MPFASAQTVDTPEAPAVEGLKRNLAAAQGRSDLAAVERAKIEDNYKAAISEARAAALLRAESAEIAAKQTFAAEQVRQLEQEAATAAEASVPGLPALADALPLTTLEAIEGRIRGEIATARERLADLDRSIGEIPLRLREARRMQATLRDEVKDLEARTAASPPGTEGDELGRSMQASTQARLDARRARLERLEHEIAYQPSLARILTLRHDVALSDLANREAELREIDAQVRKRQVEQIATLRADAASLRERAAREADPALAIAAEAQQWNAKLAETNLALDRAAVELTARRRELAALEQRVREAKQRALAGDHIDELPRELAEEWHGLRRTQDGAAARERRARDADRVGNERAEARHRREELADIGAAARAAIAAQGASIPAERRAAADRALREQLLAERNVLARLDAQQTALLGAYDDLDDADALFAQRSREAREEVVRLLFWVPLSPVGAETLKQLRSVSPWLADPALPRAIEDTWLRTSRSEPLRTWSPFAVALALIALRRRLAATLAALSPAVLGPQRFHVGHTIIALAVTLLLALPVSLLLWALGAPLRAAPLDAPRLLQSLGFALQYVAVELLVMLTLWWLTEEHGVATAHFQWRRTAVRSLRNALPILIYAYVPLAFVTTLGSWEAPDAVRQSLGRLAFIAAMAVGATFLHVALRGVRSEHSARERADAKGAIALVGPVVTWAIPLLPIGLAALAAAGFYFAAIFVLQLVATSIAIVVIGVLLYGLIAVWAAVQRLRLARVQASARAAAAEASASPEGVPIAPAALDVEAIDRATRQFLNTVITVAVALALWALWHEAFPAFDRIGNLKLWAHAEIVNGVTVENAVTVGQLLQALLVGVVALIATKNAGGMLDVILLRRLALQADANYAIKTIARYVFAGVGVVAVVQILKIEWSRAQWLLAALGVGLGFGLQEIVANFVSGLIVLAERPIRVGDIVTAGGTSGHVTRIRARATVIVDSDNKEVLIPNKEFITQRVVNWTLSSEMTRLLLKIHVAYSATPERAQQWIEAAVHGVPGVLADPAPTVYLMSFGDDALEFEVRAYCACVNERLPLLHALNTAIVHALEAGKAETPLPQPEPARAAGGVPRVVTTVARDAISPATADPRSPH